MSTAQQSEFKKYISQSKAKEVGDALKIDWNKIPFAQFHNGINVELEHGKVTPETNVTNDDLIKTGKIALAHLLESGDYYTELAKMEAKLENSEIPVEILYNQPVVQQLLSKIDALEHLDLESEVKLPYIMKDKILMSPGVWNGYFYNVNSIHDAFRKSAWDRKEIRSLFNDHEDSRSREWIGEVRNARMVGNDVVGDLYIIDKPTAMKLAYGAKMGISPKVSGHEEGGIMREFTFDNFSVVINPAVKTAYINNMEANKMANKDKPEAVEKEKEEEMTKKCEMSTPVPPVEEKKESKKEEDKEEKEEEKVEKKAFPEVKEEKELSEYTDFVKDFVRKGGKINETAKAWEKKKMSETITMSDVMSELSSMKKIVQEMAAKLNPEPVHGTDPASSAGHFVPPESGKDARKDPVGNLGVGGAPSYYKSEVPTKQTLSEVEMLKEQIKVLENRFNEPARASMRVVENSEKGDMDMDILNHLKGMGGF
jgi:hypothetical protein